MGLNFHIKCTRHRVVGMIARGHESEVLHRFYAEHSECRKNDPDAVEVQADEESEQNWMSDPEVYGYTDVGLLRKPILHICEPADTTTTLCGLRASLVAALNFSERPRGRGPFCSECETKYQEQRKIDNVRDD